MKSFIIIGGGASAVILAAQLLRASNNINIRLFEQSGNYGSGIAYSTENADHLLNVRAGNMSAFPDMPDDFVQFLQSGQHDMQQTEWTAQSFAPRRLYRQYLQQLLTPYLKMLSPSIVIEAAQIVDLQLTNGVPVVTTATGNQYESDAVILATGNEPSIDNPKGRVAEYWSSNGFFDIPPELDVVIFGTGLSMVDSVISLLKSGHEGRIYAMSRRGLIPLAHKSVQPITITADEFPSSAKLSELLRSLRMKFTEMQTEGGDWRSIMDALRPHTKNIWQALTAEQKSRFLRHLRPWWDVHRHRMAPEIAAIIDAAIRSGQLNISAAQLISVREGEDGIDIQHRRRHAANVQSLRVGAIIDCRGGNTRFSTTRNPVLISLMEHGLARPDALDLGIETTDDLQLINPDGDVSNGFYAIGPLTKGKYWEVTAVPDIRLQAERLVQKLLAD